MDYDVLILGGGIIGCSVAYELSKYNLNIAVIEKDYDIADDIALINTEMVYNGSECEDEVLSKLENEGNSMIEDITSKFNVPYKKTGAFTIATDDKSVKELEKMHDRARRRGIKDVFLLDMKQAKKIEQNIDIDFKKALYCPNVGIVAPYDLAIAYAEVAFDNGAVFRLEEMVLDIKKIVNGFKVTTNKYKFTCRVVVNTTPGEYNIVDRDSYDNKEDETDLVYLMIDEKKRINSSSIISKICDYGNIIRYIPGMYDVPIIRADGNQRLGINKTIEMTNDLIPIMDKKDINSVYHDRKNNNIMIIDDNENYNGYIRVKGNHYAAVTMTPAIASMICKTIVGHLTCSLNKNFIDKRRQYYRFREMNDEQRNEAISIDKRYGKMTCICNLISEGEIVDSIRRPLGARTVEGVKRRTGATFGNCHGAQCISKIINILARELNKKPTEIVEDSKNSNVLASRIKEFKD